MWTMKTKVIAMGFALISSSYGWAQASPDEVDSTAPYIYPGQKCPTDKMLSPEGKSFRYLFSKDCRVVHVLPPAQMPQAISAQPIDLTGGCEHYLDLREQSRKTAQRRNKIRDQLDDLLQQKLNAKTEKEQKKIEARIASLETDFEKVKVDLADIQAELKASGRHQAVRFVVNVSDEVSPNDLARVRAINANILVQPVTTKIIEKKPDGSTTESETTSYIESSVRAAPIHSSIYSFRFYAPDALYNGGVLSTSIPGLAYLQQKDGQEGILHVQSSGGVSGELIMSREAVCPRTKVVDGEYVLDDLKDPFFQISRQFAVNQMYGRGYTASLRTERAIELISKKLIESKENGFQKSVTFTPTLKGKVDSLIDFRWTEEFQNNDPQTLEAIYKIKVSVAADLIDELFDKLVESGALQIKQDPVVDPSEGGYIDKTQTAHRCWTEKKGGLSGITGGRRTVCSDFVYTVKEWKDGITHEDINKSLNILSEIQDHVVINTVTPFYFNTIFSNVKSQGEAL
jgi:hypothetical protein